MKRDWNLLHIIAMIFLVIGFGVLIKNLVILYTGITTEGIVISIKKKKNTSTKPSVTYTYYPEVTFNLENGESRTVDVSYLSTNRRISHRVGDKVKLVYSKDDYTQVRINSFFWIYGFPGTMILMGMIAWGLGSYDFSKAP